VYGYKYQNFDPWGKLRKLVTEEALKITIRIECLLISNINRKNVCAILTDEIDEMGHNEKMFLKLPCKQNKGKPPKFFLGKTTDRSNMLSEMVFF